MKCRFCYNPLSDLFLSLGLSPLANSYLKKEQLSKTESFYPLEVYVCRKCFLVQLQEFESRENIFGNYVYLSSYSDIWVKHAKDYVDKMTNIFNLDKNSFAVEIASNDGYLLQFFLQKGIPVLGIEPARNVAAIAQKKGIPTEAVFFGVETAKRLISEGKAADMLLGNNVLAHAPDINDFVAGLKILLKQKGVITMEFPHLLNLIDNVEFDTIYHEHFSYLTFLSVEKIFAAHKLTIFDVEKLETHGGSLRIYAKHAEFKERAISDNVGKLKAEETRKGYTDIAAYKGFDNRVKNIKKEILDFLTKAKKAGKVVVGYGAPAKGNTLLNYCAINSDLINYTVDKNPYKQGCYLPGSHILVEFPDKVLQTKPDYLFILPWNIKDEIMEQMAFIRKWGGKFVVPIPKVQVI